MSIYFIVVFTYEDLQSNKDVEFNLMIESALRTTRAILEDEPQIEPRTTYVDVRFWRRSSSYPTIAKYDQYPQVYFLNQAAIMMCEENGIELKVIGTVSEEGLPPEVIVQAQERYLPISSTPERYM